MLSQEAANIASSGGIRGIVEIEILKAIQARLGKIPIQAFFDLVIGTR